MAEKFYVTTAIDYVNAEPHIGHAYQKIVADALARWSKLVGKDVFFVTGTDEHGKKVEEAAKSSGKPTKEFVDSVVVKFKAAWKSLDIDYDRFIRTTDPDHQKVVVDFIKRCDKAGDIYKGFYEGYYCTGCEAYYTEKDITEGKCPLHNRPLDKISEESYFFKLSKYKKFLLDLYKTDFVLPEIRRNEVKSRVEKELKDLSITRTSFDWGIPFPLDKKHIVYVWFDALINYYTATRAKGKEKFWGKPAVHVLGKDNTWFHTVYWPAMLKSAGIDLPKAVLNHGFLTFNGQKISKSLGNSISPITLVEKYGSDAVRYFCLRNFSFASGSDGDFNEEHLVSRYNTELADKYGNLVSRVSALAEKYGFAKAAKVSVQGKETLKKVKEHFEKFEVDKALAEIFSYVDQCNEYIQNKKPWESHDKKVLYELLFSIRNITILLSPFIPKATNEIAKHFGFKLDLKDLDKPLKIKSVTKPSVIFAKIETTQKEGNLSGHPKSPAKPNLNKSEEPKEIMEGIMSIQYSDFTKLDLRVAKILNVEEIKDADKLYKLTVDIGIEKRTICAGIKEYYSAKELKGKLIVVLVNLQPRMLKGVESQGMLLAASNKEAKTCVLLTPDKETLPGTKIS